MMLLTLHKLSSLVFLIVPLRPTSLFFDRTLSKSITRGVGLDFLTQALTFLSSFFKFCHRSQQNQAEGNTNFSFSFFWLFLYILKDLRKFRQTQNK